MAIVPSPVVETMVLGGTLARAMWGRSGAVVVSNGAV